MQCIPFRQFIWVQCTISNSKEEQEQEGEEAKLKRQIMQIYS